jgi:hypothetical protein
VTIHEIRSRLRLAAQVARANGSPTADLARLRAAKYDLVPEAPNEGLCLPRHRDRPRWRRVGGGPWVCGECHPPALDPDAVEWSAAPVGGWTFELARDLAEPIAA